MSNEKNPVMWFEIPTTDLSRAIAFYNHVFDLELKAQPMGDMPMAFFSMQDESYGAAGTLVQTENYTPSEEGVLIYFSSDDIDATLARVEEKGGKIVTPKTSIGEYGFIGRFRDSEGNRIGLHSMT